MNLVTSTFLRALALEGATDNVVAIDLTDIRSDADQFLIYTASSYRLGKRIEKSVGQALRQEGIHYRVERSHAWTVFDTGDTLIHVFTPASGRYYRLERLWGMCPQTVLPIAPAA